MLQIKFSGSSSRLIRPCSCVQAFFCWSGIPDCYYAHKEDGPAFDVGTEGTLHR